MTHFELTNVRSGYGRSFAVELPSLSIRARRLNIITGANGSGKSTLLNVLAFLKRPDQGEMSFAGQLVTWKKSDLQQLRQRVTLVDQTPYLFSGTVGSNVGFGLKLRGVRDEQLDQGISNALSLVCLADFERRDVRQLSGGEHRRVAIARAIALNPEVLLLDEPLANLDTHSTRVVERLISVLPEFGTTAVMATHDISIAERFDCDVICLAGGRLDRSPEVPVCRPSMMPAY